MLRVSYLFHLVVRFPPVRSPGLLVLTVVPERSAPAAALRAASLQEKPASFPDDAINAADLSYYSGPSR